MASLLLAGRVKILPDQSIENQLPLKTQSFIHFYAWFDWPTALGVILKIWDIWTSSSEQKKNMINHVRY